MIPLCDPARVSQVPERPVVVGDGRPLPVEALPGSPVPPGDGSRDALDRPQPHRLLPQQSQGAFSSTFLLLLFLTKYDCFLTASSCVHAAGRWRSREDQPGVAGREERPGRDLLGPEALLRQYLPGAAGRSLRLSVAPPSGTWDGTACTWSTLLHYSGGPVSRR